MNRLKDSTSPYLQQHADNPVDWYPWGEEALEKARQEDKPILLSIGYSACHWCHVMAHESFENPETAAIMNRDFVNIKVDREERPDLDDIYMQATLMFNHGNGGWPMTVFLLPDGRPIHAGTYYPSTDRHQMPSFRRVMAAVLDAYRNRRDQVLDVANQVTVGLQHGGLGVNSPDNVLTETLLEAATLGMLSGFDSVNGGLSKGRPKFPSPMNLEFLLRTYAHTGNSRALEAVTFTLRKMARGGIYDQIGGGFHRYSVDEHWLVPHFEKMLYDNAQLSRLYLHTWLATKDEFFKKIAVETYDYILREMTSPEGGFYSTTDADSEGEEGKFFVWKPDEIRAVLTPREAELALAFWNVTDQGNFEEHNILTATEDPINIFGGKFGLAGGRTAQLIERAREKLYKEREKRVHPGRDEKILTAWNGMMLASLAEAARVLNRDDYKQAAIRNAEFLLTIMRSDGRLLRSYKDGHANINGYLEDYANLAEGLLELYQTTFDVRYYSEAVALVETVLMHFKAPEGGFFDTSDDHEALIARPRNLQDNATPSGGSMISKVLLKLAAYMGGERYEEAARPTLIGLASAMQEYPTAFGEALNAADLLIRGIKEVTIVGDPAQTETQALLDVLTAKYWPNIITALTKTDADEKTIPPLLAYRTLVNGKPAAYVCESFVCQRPVTEPEALRTALDLRRESV